jgi:hypothetical protein
MISQIISKLIQTFILIKKNSDCLEKLNVTMRSKGSVPIKKGGLDIEADRYIIFNISNL